MTRTDALVEVLQGLGVDIKRVSQDEVNGRCPVHYLYKGRMSSRFSWYINADTGLWLCFTCGARGNLSMLVSLMTDSPSALWEVQKHLIVSGLHNLSADEEQIESSHTPINWSDFSKFDRLPSYVLDRRSIDSNTAYKMGIRWDTHNRAVVIPIVSPLGELWGWQLKKTDWVRNHPIGVHKGSTLFGIERAVSSTGILLESPLDVVRFHSVYEGPEFSAVASFGANVSAEQISLMSARFDRLIVALDNDKAGKLETKRLRKRLPSFRKGIKFWSYPSTDVKDLGDMTDFQIIHGLSQVTSIYV